MDSVDPQPLNNEFVQMANQLRLDHEIPTQLTTDNNQENNPNLQNKNNLTRDMASKSKMNVKSKANGSTKNTTTGPSNSANTRITESSSAISNPRVYEMAEYYKQRKEYKLQKVKAEEERLRKHTARPMPNFRAIHLKFPALKNSAEACVSPETPEVLRRGLAMKEKQKQKIKEHEQKLAERPPIVSRPAKVLKEEPFKPTLPPHPELKVQPFKLQMTDRMKDRKEFDSNYQRELIKKKEQEQLRKQQEEERSRQLLRQQTNFKANPNPFKKN